MKYLYTLLFFMICAFCICFYIGCGEEMIYYNQKDLKYYIIEFYINDELKTIKTEPLPKDVNFYLKKSFIHKKHFYDSKITYSMPFNRFGIGGHEFILNGSKGVTKIKSIN